MIQERDKINLFFINGHIELPSKDYTKVKPETFTYFGPCTIKGMQQTTTREER